MRYQVGQKVPVVACVIKGQKPFGVTIPLLHDDKQPDSVFMKMLTVTEHHRVPNHWESDPEKKDCDGYILSDEQGARWLNQYPRASYGQTTDHADRQFEADLSKASKEEIEKALGNEESYPLFYECLDQCIERILRGIEQLPHGHEKVPQLNRLLMTIEAKAREVFPEFRYEYVPIIFKSNDGSESSYPDIKHVVITINGEVL